MIVIASLSANMLRALLKVRMDRVNAAIQNAPDDAGKVAAYRQGLSIPAGSIVLGNYQVEETELAGVPVTWISRDQYPADRVVIFLHGGGYIGGSVLYTRNSAADIARISTHRVVSVDYRLAPEFPFPAALDDVLAVYGVLLDQQVAPGNIIFIGESAGGGLAIATALALQQKQLPLPAAVVALSPWCDLTCSNITLKANTGKDVMLTADFLTMAARMYAGDADRMNPLLSPLYGNLEGFPPLLVHVAAEELLVGEILALADGMNRAGVDVQLSIYEGVWHVWQTVADLMPEARQAMDEIGRFICSHSGLQEETAPVPDTEA